MPHMCSPVAQVRPWPGLSTVPERGFTRRVPHVYILRQQSPGNQVRLLVNLFSSFNIDIYYY